MVDKGSLHNGIGSGSRKKTGHSAKDIR